ncbi:MAG TPA: hypothetical protein VFU43_26260 [Streptosporangiaceae bacterium]|nr:hypothetical protein [Streptosporangiaceae bacterium]
MRPDERDGGGHAAHGAAGWPDWGPASGRGPSPVEAEPAAEPTAPDSRLGIFIVAAAALLVLATFLPWATATPHAPDVGLLPGGPDDALGAPRDYTGVQGRPGMSVLVAALAAALLGGAGAVLGRRLTAYAAIPALTALAALGLFVARGHWEVVDKAYGDTLRGLPPPLGQLLRSTMETSLGIGWWLSLALALILLGAGIVGLARVPPAASDGLID